MMIGLIGIQLAPQTIGLDKDADKTLLGVKSVTQTKHPHPYPLSRTCNRNPTARISPDPQEWLLPSPRTVLLPSDSPSPSPLEQFANAPAPANK